MNWGKRAWCCQLTPECLKKKNGENQPIILCTELKIVINRACFKNKKVVYWSLKKVQ